MAFLAAENENRQLDDLPQADFSRVLERLFVFALYDFYRGIVDLLF